MKKIGQLIFFFFLTIILLSNKSLQISRTNSNENIFVNDSGYVSIKNGEKFLLELNKNDSIDFSYKKLDANDTIGKYYKKENSPNYYLFLNDILNAKLGSSQFILEVDSEGNIIKSERFINGFYLCCWNNKYDGFGKLKDYFFIKCCGTGSGFCSSNIYLFKEIFPQDKLNTITQEVWSSLCAQGKKSPLSCSIDSKIEIKPKSLVFHYKYEKGIITKSNKFKIKETENFDIEYVLKDKSWIALDSTKLDKIPN